MLNIFCVCCLLPCMYSPSYGPGMVIYWFGFVEDIDRDEGRRLYSLVVHYYPTAVLHTNTNT
jgi:Protein of unknown function TPD sequence-motif